MVHHDNTYVHSFGVFFLILNGFLAADMTTEGNSLLKESKQKKQSFCDFWLWGKRGL